MFDTGHRLIKVFRQYVTGVFLNLPQGPTVGSKQSGLAVYTDSINPISQLCIMLESYSLVVLLTSIILLM